MDGKYILVISGGPDWAVINYSREKGRAIQILKNQATSTTPFYSGSFAPFDSNIIVCIGFGILKFYHIDQLELKILPIHLPKRDNQNYTCHTWDNDNHLFIASENGEILIFNGIEFIGIFNTQSKYNIYSITTFSKGFICGCNNGIILIYEKMIYNNSNDNYLLQKIDMFKKLNEIHIPNEEINSIIHLIISLNEEYIICVLENNQLYQCYLSQLQILKDNNNNNNDILFIPFLNSSFHFGKINGLDLTIRKPFIITCGEDKCIKIWNYHDKTMLFSKRFEKEPLCISAHPSGMHIAVGFHDKLRLMNVLMDDLQIYQDFSIKGCTQVKYSNGGHLLAAVNASVIQIYTTYSLQIVTILKGHTAKIHSIWWSLDDRQIITTSADNSIFIWDIINNTQYQQHQNKEIHYNSAIIAPGKMIIASSSDQTLKMIDNDNIIKQTIDLPIKINCIEITKSPPYWLLNGGLSGIILSIPLTKFEERINISNNTDSYHLTNRSDISGISNLNDKNIINNLTDNNIIELQIHSQCITNIQISHDDTLFVTSSEDGCICVFELKTKPLLTNKKRELQQQLGWAEEIIITKKDLDERFNQIKIFKKKVEDLRLNNQLEINIKDDYYKKKLEDLNCKFQNEIKIFQSKYNILSKQSEESRIRYKQELNILQNKYIQNFNEIEKYQKDKIEAERKRCEELKKKLENLREKLYNII
ncbi:hypothetical protein RFI_22950 [Reticulomyxa filosa]|uniref:Uncharacterized protein n=1 Tax=Reticulomyxa filosa TaxID=46433 RepID=X6MKR0_RETFI|nr:hypothetical protein RFI_22950 [Reticulomyxa filosa]|eukprot:ETO14419.1 hypothetical protein RFI_22950 [Reticulomyxa filosa]